MNGSRVIASMQVGRGHAPLAQLSGFQPSMIMYVSALHRTVFENHTTANIIGLCWAAMWHYSGGKSVT